MVETLKRFNWVMFLAMAALIAIGTVATWSAGNARSEAVFHTMWVNNLVTAVVGLVIYFVLTFTDYRRVLDFAAIPAYIGAVVLLIAVLIFGSTVYGGKRWLWFFQPSEISKLCIIMMVAALFGVAKEGDWKQGFRGFLAAVAIVGMPTLLVLAEPDLGTALTLLPATALMLFVAKIWRGGLIAITVIIAIVVATILGLVYEAEKPGVDPMRRAEILKYVPLKDHQVKRVKVFLFPNSDITGSGYNLRQAKISIGSGGLAGKGLGKGETNLLKYLPQAISMNDFIFCVWAEETGFVGSMVLLALFVAVLLPICWVAFIAGDSRGRLLSLGIAMLIFAHVYINIAMSVGVAPITGLPLPFISSGRTFLITIMSSLGLIQSVSIHREEESE